MYTLVIIDMQSYFSSSKKKSVQKHVSLEIEKAIAKKAAIIFVEYIGCGPTLPNLVRLTDSYSKTFLVRKNKDCGGKEVMRLIKNNRLPVSNIRVCGVNTDACVLETIQDLSKRARSTIKVVARACNSCYKYSHENGLRSLKSIKKVRIV